MIKIVSCLRQGGGFPHDISSHVFVLEVFASFYDVSLRLWSCSYGVSVWGFSLFLFYAFLASVFFLFE